MAMTPILFPYTTLSARHRDLAGRFFPTLTVLRPLGTEPRPPAADGAREAAIIDHAPFGDRRGELAKRIAEYRRWAQQHPGTDLAAWAGRGQAVPFFV